MSFATVVIEGVVPLTLDYSVPNTLEFPLQTGMRVEVPLRGRSVQGYVLELKETTDIAKVAPIRKVVSDQVLIDKELLTLALFMSRYYCAPLSNVFKTILPATVRADTEHKKQLFVRRLKSKEVLRQACIEVREKSPIQAEVLEAMLKVSGGILLTELMEQTGSSRSPIDTLAKKGFLSLDTVVIDRSPLDEADFFRTDPKILTGEQAIALAKISSAITDKRFETHLLYGVTGSGKTEVYLQAIAQALELGRGTIMLVPEIALTQQTIERFRSRFEGHIAILHHRLSAGERFDEWHRIRRGDAQIVIGARSAIFSPVKNLGLIIVDEEHEPTYKQTDDAPCYHARDIAVMRGKIAKAVVVLGSATPSLESYHNAKQGKYILSTLTVRPGTVTLPTVTIVDMRREFEKSNGFTTFSDALLTGIKKRIEAGEQTILFLNRRGYHTTLLCQECQKAIECPHCSTALTFHKNGNTLACHLCGYALTPPPVACPTCHSRDTMKFRGIGTEQVEKAIHAIFPDVRTIRLDADTTKHKGSHHTLLREFRSGKADVLIGTQMIAKGLHFPEVTLVGVLNSDATLQIPDFRASETAFQLITQVSGRSGRGSLPGEVIIQTQMPDNETILLASQQNYPAFYDSEITSRDLFGYPPFCRLIKVRFSGPDEKATLEFGNRFLQTLERHLNGAFALAPLIPAGHAKVKDRYYFQFLAKGQNIFPFSAAMAKALLDLRPPSSIRILTDVDPSSTYF